jgi:hypothetical protein
VRTCFSPEVGSGLVEIIIKEKVISWWKKLFQDCNQPVCRWVCFSTKILLYQNALFVMPVGR